MFWFQWLRIILGDLTIMNHRPGLNPKSFPRLSSSGLSGEPLSDHGLPVEDTAWVPSEGQSFWMVSLLAIYGYIVCIFSFFDGIVEHILISSNI